MTRNADGSVAWTHTTRLYRKLGNLRSVVVALAVTVAISFVLVQLLCISSMSFKFFLSQCRIWGLILGGMLLLSIVGYYIWAWAHGGVDERAYAMDEHGIRCRQVVHCAGRMKFLRGFACILMLAPQKPGQRLAMRNLLHDVSSDETKLDFAEMQSASGDAVKGVIKLQMQGEWKEIAVSPEDFDEAVSYIQERIQCGTRRRKKKT